MKDNTTSKRSSNTFFSQYSNISFQTIVYALFFMIMMDALKGGNRDA